MMNNNEEEGMVVCPKGLKIAKEALVKVIIQALFSLDDEQSAKSLKSESGFTYVYQPKKFENLRTQFLNGLWEECAGTLCTIVGLEQASALSPTMYVILHMWLFESLVLDEGFDVSKVLESQYASHLEELDQEKLSTSVDDFCKMGNPNYLGCLEVSSSVVEARKMMLNTLESWLPLEVAMSDDRLLALIEQGVSAQIDSCLTHNTKQPVSLYRDHSCGQDSLPTKTMEVLMKHRDEVCCIKFSHNGQYLATASQDGTAIIWEVPSGSNLTIRHVLRGHRKSLYNLSWSPNDEWLLTCGYSGVLKIWNVLTGRCTHTLSEEEQVFGSCALLSDQLDIVYGSLKKFVHLVRNGGAQRVSFSRTGEGSIKDFAMTPDGTKLILIYPDDETSPNPEKPEGKAIIQHTDTGDMEIISEEAAIVAFSISEDSRSLILNLDSHEIHVWDLTRMIRPLIYWSSHEQYFPTRSCFGGVESAFLVSGTNNSMVYIWNRRNVDHPVAIMRHYGSHRVSCVSWNPTRPEMLASASVNTTICIWGPQDI